MLSNTYLWSAVGLVIFFALMVRFGVHRMVLKALDSRGEAIAAELAEAKKLRDDAQALLAEYKAKRNAAEAEAAAIVAAAQEDAERLAKEAEAKLADFITRRTRNAELKIAQVEAQASADVRAAAADAATRAAEQVLRGQMAGPAGATMLSRSLGDIKGKLN
ncbi:MAG: ATP F0F1 synthase subunit B [Bosea sp.]|jgi:F-type H+-transporting ATPase subunit b|nr:ATP F0F1 synthase subunit B [Bosea sp. (in: a-proteobacteria)]